MRAGFPTGKNRGVFRFDRENFYVWIGGFENFANAGNRSTRTNASDKGVDFGVRVTENFLGGCLSVSFRVGGVFKLLRNERAGVCQPVRG